MFSKECGMKISDEYGIPVLQSEETNNSRNLDKGFSKDSLPQKRKNKWLMFLIVIVLVVLAGCDSEQVDTSNKYIDFVKTGEPNIYPGQRYGEAFEDYFAEPKWEYFNSNEDRDIVEFTGRCMYEGKEVTAKIQFELDWDAGTFSATYLDLNDISQSAVMLSILLDEVFESNGGVSKAIDVEIAEGTMGEECTWGDYGLLVNGTSVVESEFDTKKGMRIDVTILNKGTGKIYYSPNYFEIETINGQLLGTSWGEDQLGSEALIKGGYVDGILYFDCELTEAAFLHFGEGQTRIKIKLEEEPIVIKYENIMGNDTDSASYYTDMSIKEGYYQNANLCTILISNYNGDLFEFAIYDLNNDLIFKKHTATLTKKGTFDYPGNAYYLTFSVTGDGRGLTLEGCDDILGSNPDWHEFTLLD